jgi:predicted nucleotidyltransferase
MSMSTTVAPRLDQSQKESLITELTAVLKKEKRVVCAYLHGSFVSEGPFRDVDLGVYLEPSGFKDSDEMFRYGLSLGAECDLAISGVTIDLRPLNMAPLPFRFDVVTRGRLLFTKNDALRIDFEGRTRSLYFDFLPHLQFHHRKTGLGE